VANLIGCLLIGMLLVPSPHRARLDLWGGIGLCDSLTPCSSWMLELVQGLEAGRPLQVLAVLAISLLGGLALEQLGYGAARAIQRS
jgi:fluoride ion exporter CrcB/FEX